jgi:glycosyltransferase involved in cell wall biosynthesis
MPTAPLKVCLIQDYLPPYRIPLFTKIAAAGGIDFTLLIMARGHASYEQWADLWRNPPFKCALVPGWRFRLKSEAESGLNPRLFFALARRRPDVVICSGFSFNTILALAYRALFRKRVIVWTEATATSESYLSYPRLRTRIRRVLARWVDGFVDAGTEARIYAQSLIAQSRSVPFFRSYNAIDNDDFARRCDAFHADAAAFEAFRRRFAPRNILFSGQLIERKNIRRLLDVYEAILGCNADPIGLIVLGQGPLQDYLVERKREHGLRHLYVEGFQLAEDYYKYFAAADVFMLLSVYDCNPLVIFEALAAGLPAICSKYAGNAIDLIADGENGFIVDPEEVADVATKTLTILNAEDRGPVAAAARAAVRKANYGGAAQAFVDAIEEIARR